MGTSTGTFVAHRPHTSQGQKIVGKWPFRMKKGFPVFTGNPARGAKGIRTPDPLHAMEMRYQLRHSPVVCLANVE